MKTIVLCSGLLLTHAGIAIVLGVEESGLLQLLRATARTTTLFFLGAFVASALVQLSRWPVSLSLGRWLMRNRRSFGITAAFSHFLHLLALLRFLQISDVYAVDAVTLVVGGLGFVVLFAMGLTSNDGAQRWLGRRWKWLHRYGAWFVWFVLLATFAGNATTRPSSAVAALLLIAAALVRIRAWVRERRTSRATV